ncbi:hypothetical protein ALC57_13137 [Trachymyrmex cornetzi]|uniref:Uncharacterized protein n=1 Tax=Trachymyrmex cornetzi TaxID=471704 RepID=A0A151J013_9HYME|nr:hypothetical protein ALC57_13137 [Trachymyrmex cornetzi]
MWTDKSRAMLLHLYKKYKCDFDSNIPKSTGAAPLKCDNFDELDELFGNKPNVIPVASSSGNGNKFKVTQEEFSDVKDCDKKQRKRASAITLSDLKIILEEKEEAKKARHEQRQELFRQSITSHERMMDKLLDKF